MNTNAVHVFIGSKVFKAVLLFSQENNLRKKPVFRINPRMWTLSHNALLDFPFLIGINFWYLNASETLYRHFEMRMPY